MLLTVKETAQFLGEKEKNIYYLIYICRLDAVRVRSDWRICSDSVEKEYVKRTRENLFNKNLPCDYGLRRFEEYVASVRKNNLQANQIWRNTQLERRRGMEYAAKRCNSLPREQRELKAQNIQLEFAF